MNISSSSTVKRPIFTPNTASYLDEGTSTAGWTLSNATMSQPDATTVRLNQTTAGGGNGTAYRGITMPTVNKDWCLYARCRARRNASDAHRITLQANTGLAPATGPRMTIYFNFNSVTNSSVNGTISLRYTTAGGTNTNIVVATGVSYDTVWQDFVLYYCSKFNTVTCEFRTATGGFTYGARTTASFFGAQLDLVTNNTSVAGAYFEFDFLELVKPNIIAIGDSSTAGNTLFSPNPAEGLTDGTSRSWHDCPIYLTTRNNYIGNKGVGGDTSAMVAARIAADAVNNGPKLVIVGACNNDNASITLAQRTINIQSSITALTTAGIKNILMNAVYRTATTPPGGQPAYRDYYRDWWMNHKDTLVGVNSYWNPMVVLRDANEYLDPAYTQADGGHSNVAGYRRRKQQLAGLPIT